MKTGNLFLSFYLGIGLVVVLLLLLSMDEAAASDASLGSGGVFCVAPDGGSSYQGCTLVFTNVQDAVAAATGGEIIKIASGLYTGVHTCLLPSGNISQVVYISKTLLLRGGYTTTNWLDSFPVTQPTVLDAEGDGRVMVITGYVTVSLEGLHITGGTADGQGGIGLANHGGGIYVSRATVVISGSYVYSNTTSGAGGHGGGLYAKDCGGLELLNSAVFSNTATGDYGAGGGAYIWCEGDVVVTGNDVGGNRGTAGLWNTGVAGGGLIAGSRGGDTTISGNMIYGNATFGPCGGLVIGDNTVVSHNLITRNSAAYFGGGLCLGDESRNVLVEGNEITANQLMMRDERGGGGVYIGHDSTDVVFVNNLVTDNQLTGGEGSPGVEVRRSQGIFLHSTIVRNRGGNGSGVYATSGSRVALTNTIISSHTVGVLVDAGSIAHLEATLWGTGTWANEADWFGEGDIVSGSINVWGDPVFADPDAGDYHIESSSAAIDAGVDTGVFIDIDTQVRDDMPDIGSDEYLPPIAWKRLYLPLICRW